MKTKISDIAFSVLLISLAGVAQADPPSNPFDYTRTTSFTYNADGTLATNVVEPSQSDVCSVKTYTYDHGNVATVSLANCAGANGRVAFAPRTLSTATFAAVPSQLIQVGGVATAVAVPAGSVQSSQANALGQAETYQVDPRFSVKIRVTGPNGLSSTAQLDDWGRVARSVSADGTSQVQAYCVLTTAGVLDSSQASNSANCPVSFAAGEVPVGARMVMQSEPHDVANVKMGAYSRTYTDFLGRTIRTVTEGFDGDAQTAGKSGSPVVVDTVYDGFGNKVLETQPYFLTTGSSSTTGANDVGVAQYQYDFLGRVVANYVSSTADASTTQVFGSSSSAVTYGSYGSKKASKTVTTYAGQSVTTVSDKGQVRLQEKDASGVVVRVTDALGAQVVFRRDAFGNLVTLVDALQNTISTQFDLLGNKIVTFDPDKGVTGYCYDASGQLKATQTSVQRGGSTPTVCPNVSDTLLTASAVPGWTTLAYDKSGRLTQRNEPEFVTTNFYDFYADGSACAKGIGRLCESSTTNGVGRKYAYDSMGRVVGERTDIASSGMSFAKSSTFDTTTGRRVTQTYPTGLQVGYSYTSLGYMQQLVLKTGATVSPQPDAQNQVAAGSTLAADSVLWKANKVDARGSLEQAAFGNGVIDTRAYSPESGRLVSISAGTPAAAAGVLSHSYTWDSLNNLTARSDNNGDGSSGAVNESFGFDALNRLNQYSVQGTQLPGYARAVTLNFNALGMVLSKTDVGNYSYSAQGGAQPHAVRSIGGTSYGYDLDGNLTSANGGKYSSVSYTSFDMVSAVTGASQYNWLYDANHSRVKETRVGGGNTRTTYYVNPDAAGTLSFETEMDSSPSIQSNRHFLNAYGAPVGVLVSTGPLPTLASNQLTPPAPTGGGMSTIPLVAEGATFTVTGTQTVRYGAGTSWAQRAVTDSGVCGNDFFGGDPIFGTAKTCELVVTGFLPLTTEGNSFTVSGTQLVRYGAGGSWYQRSVTGTGQCNNAFFGGDPLFNTAKSCELVAGSGLVLNKVEYWERDHLGSLVATTDHTGAVTARLSYDPFGKRRYANGMYDAAGNLVIDWSPTLNSGGARGFTGHEELDDIGLVNMNGRLYDDTVGLFIQADPHIADSENLQNYNRYSYVLNNPLNATDPSGFDSCDFCGSGFSFGGSSFTVPTYFGSYSSSTNYFSSYGSSGIGSFGSTSSLSMSSQLPSTVASNSYGFSPAGFVGFGDGLAGMQTSTMQTNSGNWILGNALGQAVGGVTQVAGMAVDIFRAPVNAAVNLFGVPQLATPYVSDIGKAVASGEMSAGWALYSVFTAPAQAGIQIASDYYNGNWQAASASSLAMFMPVKFARIDPFLTRSEFLPRDFVGKRDGFYEPPQKLEFISQKTGRPMPSQTWDLGTSDTIVMYHGTRDFGTFEKNNGFVQGKGNFGGSIFLSPDISQSQQFTAGLDGGIVSFKFSVPQLNGFVNQGLLTLQKDRGYPFGPEAIFQPSLTDFLNNSIVKKK